MKVIGGQVFPAEKNRDHITQAIASITDTIETTILPALSGHYHDMVMITCHNDSDAAVTINIRDATGGTVRLKLTLPASEAKSWIFHTPYKQSAKNNNWTAKRPANLGTMTLSIYTQAVKKK